MVTQMVKFPFYILAANDYLYCITNYKSTQ
jgi:hypothetical protein